MHVKFLISFLSVTNSLNFLYNQSPQVLPIICIFLSLLPIQTVSYILPLCVWQSQLPVLLNSLLLSVFTCLYFLYRQSLISFLSVSDSINFLFSSIPYYYLSLPVSTSSTDSLLYPSSLCLTVSTLCRTGLLKSFLLSVSTCLCFLYRQSLISFLSVSDSLNFLFSSIPYYYLSLPVSTSSTDSLL